MMTFGIAKDAIPISVTGEIDLENHKQWIESVKAKVQEKEKSATLVPGPMDLLLGRGRHGKNTLGNLRFRSLLEEYRSQYESCSKFDKTILAQSILTILKESGCRFLKSTNQGWIQVEDDVVREKISHAFRNLRNTTQAASNKGGSKRPNAPSKRR